VVVVLMEMGQITPPVGINVFALASVAQDVPMASIFRRVLPYFICMLILVCLLYAFPSLALWLPSVVL
jgi:TRAP-type C4-dicarboxylate transport system permease large subunit